MVLKVGLAYKLIRSLPTFSAVYLKKDFYCIIKTIKGRNRYDDIIVFCPLNKKVYNIALPYPKIEEILEFSLYETLKSLK